MISKKAFILFIFISLFSESFCQDIHFSQFFYSPLNLNPAYTGFFIGKYRLSTIYRNQWKLAAGGQPYVTYSASFDQTIFDTKMKNRDAMGVGLNVYNDMAGLSSLTTTGAYVSFAFHKDLTGDGNNNIGLGIQGGMTQIGFDRSKLRFGDEVVEDVVAGSGRETFSSTQLRYIDVVAGAIWNVMPYSWLNMYLGVSTFHLTRPQVNFNDFGNKNYLSPRTSVQLGSAITLNKQVDILPVFLYMRQDASNQLNLGGAFRYSYESGIRLRLGNWYRYWRNADAMIFMGGIDYYNLTVSMAYDVNASVLKQTSKSQGGYEFALIYILNSSKTRGRMGGSMIECPKF